MKDVCGYFAGSLTAIALFGIVIVGPISCTVSEQREATKRVEATCTGDLKTDVARAIACAMATRDAHGAGR